jgi:5'(3')-deoxyribonucleotidase
LNPYPEALEAVRRLRDLGADVIFATSPNYASSTWMWERKLWLRRHFDAPEEDVVFVHRKSVVRADAMVDDKPSAVESWLSENDGHGMLWDAPYNRHASHLPRVTGWEEVLRRFGA